MASGRTATTVEEMKTRHEKVVKFETFLNEQLKPDLRTALEVRDKVYNETAEYLALKNSIEKIKESGLHPGQPLKTQVDLGCNFYCQAVVPNPGRICHASSVGT